MAAKTIATFKKEQNNYVNILITKLVILYSYLVIWMKTYLHDDALILCDDITKYILRDLYYLLVNKWLNDNLYKLYLSLYSKRISFLALCEKNMCTVSLALEKMECDVNLCRKCSKVIFVLRILVRQILLLILPESLHRPCYHKVTVII